MAEYLCIAGTDTDVGKTVVTAGLAGAAQKLGRKVLVIKAVQTGVMPTPGPDTLPACRSHSSATPSRIPAKPDSGKNRRSPDIKDFPAVAPDVLVYQKAAPGVDTAAIAVFNAACSPHLSARREGKNLTARGLADGILKAVFESSADLVLVEGAGGVLTPLNDSETIADVFSLLGWPVLLVSGNKLGAVNHALLSLQCLKIRGLLPLGFVLTQTRPAAGELEKSIRADNSGIIACQSATACLAEIKYLQGLHENSPGSQAQSWESMARELTPVLEALGKHTDLTADAPLLAFDKAHVWHPYTSALHPLRTREAVTTGGAKIRLKSGRELIDGMSSWWCAIHGYAHPALGQALHVQAGKMPHVMFGGLTHEPAVTLARRLLAMVPHGMEHVFFADSGSVAIEVAIKMALQYQQAAGASARKKLLTIRGGYHGDTMGAMSVCDPENGMHSLFSGTLPRQIFAPRPECRFHAHYDAGSEKAFERVLAYHAGSVAAVIMEPIVQGAGGMWFYHPLFLRRVRELCDKYGCLLILDEIATGFGRTGKLFAAEHAEISPDIMCVGKALTGGMMTLAATMATKEVAEGISRDGGVLMHGPTFMANPLACAVANASLGLLADGSWKENVSRVEQDLITGLVPCSQAGGVTDVRILGAIGVVEMDRPVAMEKLQNFFVEQCGVWIRPFGKLIYLMPPFVATSEDVTALTTAVQRAISEEQWK